MKTFKYIILLLTITQFAFPQNKGHLFIIGGGTLKDYLVKQFIEFAGGNDSKILIIPMASEFPKEAVESFSKKLNAVGNNSVSFIICNKENVDSESNLQKLNGVTGIFFTGGNQSNLTPILNGSKLLQKIKDIYKSGGVIGGTSAGAAVMSDIMLTGEEKLNKDSSNAYASIKKGNIITTKGFGFLNNVIVDQHFVKRKRFNRLMSVVLENPQLIGIGIDESTAIIISGDMVLKVSGESNVLIMDASNSNIQLNINDNLSADNIKLNILKSGDSYNILTHKATLIQVTK